MCDFTDAFHEGGGAFIPRPIKIVYINIESGIN